MEYVVFDKYLFSDPSKIITAKKAEELAGAFWQIEDALKNKQYVAGFVSYDKCGSFPLLWFGVFNKRTGIKQNTARSKYKISNISPNINKKEFLKNIDVIKRNIEAGRTYQVNYTFKYKFNWSGDPESLFDDLKKWQKTKYCSLIKTKYFWIISLSPELFIQINGNKIIMRPMKGTAGPGNNSAGKLKNSFKDKSENIMIVDMLRNDLGRICRPGSIKTTSLFKIEPYKTLCQMTSTVTGKVKQKTGFYEIFKSAFPSGSVTGAPKIETIKIIKSLEKEPRKIYTGAIGFITPKRDALFNVAIRTLLLNRDGKGEMGIGSGITYPSDPEKEYEECLLKAQFLFGATREFDLIETILWTKNAGFFLLGEHLERLRKSSELFGFTLNIKKIMRELSCIKKMLKGDNNYKIRIALKKDGKTSIQYSKLNKVISNRIKLSAIKTNSSNIFLSHKTTNRKIYDRQYSKYSKKGYCDIIFLNENKEITEGAASNIFILKNGKYFTPPVSCGLLPGIFRNHFIKNNKNHVEEKVLHLNALRSADKIFICNSVRGMKQVYLEV